jgi:hypothetical protein
MSKISYRRRKKAILTERRRLGVRVIPADLFHVMQYDWTTYHVCWPRNKAEEVS